MLLLNKINVFAEFSEKIGLLDYFFHEVPVAILLDIQ